mgnify:CR=1 FL=1
MFLGSLSMSFCYYLLNKRRKNKKGCFIKKKIARKLLFSLTLSPKSSKQDVVYLVATIE